MHIGNCAWATRDCCGTGTSFEPGHVIDADCQFRDGVFHLYHVADACVELGTVRFVAPADYVPSADFAVGEHILKPRVVNAPDASAFGFKAGDLVHVGVNMAQKYVFMNSGGTDAAGFASKEYVDAAVTTYNCVASHASGVFLLAPLAQLPDPLPALFSLRFKAPAAYGAGDVLRLGATDYPFLGQDNAPLPAGAFASGAVVEVQMGEGSAFFRYGGGGGVDPGPGWNIFPGQSPNPNCAPGLYIPDAVLPSAIEIDGMLKTRQSAIKQVACGSEHTVFLLTDGTVWNCGRNQYGQLGRVVASGHGDNPNLGELAGLPEVASVACGDFHTVIVAVDGTVWTCGDNRSGQLGREVETGGETSANLGRIEGVSDMASSACGVGHTMLLDSGGRVWGCGAGYYGQLGRELPGGAEYTSALALAAITDVKKIACGYAHTGFIKTDGTVWNCGWNVYGQLGRVTEPGAGSVGSLAEVAGLTGVVDAACGHYYTAFLKSDGTVWNCGHNGSNVLGRRVPNGGPTAVNLGELVVMRGTSALWGGKLHCVYLKEDGSVWTCGSNSYRQLGHDDDTGYPAEVPSLSGITLAAAAGETFTFFLKRDGTAWNCGSNGYGQLGRLLYGNLALGRTTLMPGHSRVSTDYPENTLVISISDDLPEVNPLLFSNESVSFRAPVERVYQMRSGAAADLGYQATGAGLYLPSILGHPAVRIIDGQLNVADRKVTRIACGRFHAVFLLEDGTVWNCGENGALQLGRDVKSGNNRTVNFGQLTAINNVVTMVCGDNSTHFVRSDGSVWNCGVNTYGQLGRTGVPTNAFSNTFTLGRVDALRDVVGVGVGAYHTVFRKADGTVWNCGYSDYLGRTVDKANASISNLGRLEVASDVKEVACGQYHTVFLEGDGSIWTFGLYSYGQLGRSVASGSSDWKVPTRVAGVPDVSSIVCGDNFSVFVTSDGSVWNCGDNRNGQLGRVVESGGAESVNLGRLSAISGITSVACGAEYAVLLDDGAMAWSCGKNTAGSLGRSAAIGRPDQVNLGRVANIADVVAVEAGEAFTVFLKSDGTIWGCGLNSWGQLANAKMYGSSEFAIEEIWQFPARGAIPPYRDTACLISHGMPEGERAPLYKSDAMEVYAPVKAVYQIRNGEAVPLDFRIVAA